jgi:hypothetical protein
LVLGTAKVMSYKDLEVARAKRAEKEAARAAKGKSNRGRKRKRIAPEAVEATAGNSKYSRKRRCPSPEPETLEPEAPELTANIVRISKVQIIEDKIVRKL